MTFLELVGMAGLEKDENEAAVVLDSYFRWPMFFVALWIPLQWHFFTTGAISLQTDMFLCWLIWLAFVIETVVLACTVNDYKVYLKRNWLNLVIIFSAIPLIFLEHSAASAALRLLRIIIVPKLIIKWWNHE